MQTNDHNNLVDTLEAMIDKHGTNGVCNLIAEVCSAKADHIRESYSDEVTAGTWDREAARFLGLAHNKTAYTYVVQP